MMGREMTVRFALPSAVPALQRGIVPNGVLTSAQDRLRGDVTTETRNRTSAGPRLPPDLDAMTGEEEIGLHASPSSATMTTAALPAIIVRSAVLPEDVLHFPHGMGTAGAGLVLALVPEAAPEEGGLPVLAGTTAATDRHAEGEVAVGSVRPSVDRNAAEAAVALHREAPASGPNGLALAFWAVMRSPAPHYNLPDRSSTGNARLIRTAIHAMPSLERSAAPFGIDVIGNRRSAKVDGFPKHLVYRCQKLAGARSTDVARGRLDAGAE